jgi:hypothetical protein
MRYENKHEKHKKKKKARKMRNARPQTNHRKKKGMMHLKA